MEHSALHALLLTGLIVALGGPLAVLWLLLPAARKFGIDPGGDGFVRSMLQSAARWIIYGALGATLATFIDFFVQVAEFKNQTVFGGADLATVYRFATHTTVGTLCLARAGLLLLTACVARLPGRRHWWLIAGLAWGAVIATSLVSHAAAQPGNRTVAIAAQIAHITTAAIWMGVLLHLFVARKLMLADATGGRVAFIAEIVRRFSPIALATTSLLGFTGVLAAYRYLTTMGALFTSAYGLTLVVKLVLIVPAIYAGYVNFKRIRPKLLAIAADKAADASGAGGLLAWFSKTLELEITAGVLVITVAGILGSVSPPGDDGSQLLTAAQQHVFLVPHKPYMSMAGWDVPDDPRGPTVEDLRYSEFTHNCSGMAVCLLGIAWLAQSVRGRIGLWGGRLSALILIPFGCFIALVANPELWLLHIYSPLEIFTNPILLEHQLGALMVFIIAWLTWRDQKNPEEKRPLGYPLPIIMIAGSLLLLGHAHTTSAIPDDLTNLINVQHAIFGAFGLFAGTTRYLILRGLVPTPVARYVWPSCVIGLGIFMAFFYREVI